MCFHSRPQTGLLGYVCGVPNFLFSRFVWQHQELDALCAEGEVLVRLPTSNPTYTPHPVLFDLLFSRRFRSLPNTQRSRALSPTTQGPSTLDPPPPQKKNGFRVAECVNLFVGFRVPEMLLLGISHPPF